MQASFIYSFSIKDFRFYPRRHNVYKHKSQRIQAQYSRGNTFLTETLLLQVRVNAHARYAPLPAAGFCLFIIVFFKTSIIKIKLNKTKEENQCPAI